LLGVSRRQIINLIKKIEEKWLRNNF
jgi:hypothetical protein